MRNVISKRMKFHSILSVLLISRFHTCQGLSCVSNRGGSNYRGNVSSTVSGRSCQSWDSQTPHQHRVAAADLPERDLTSAENFCRSAGGDPLGPWCYTTDPDVTWEYCDVPSCSKVGEIGCTNHPKGHGYIGSSFITEHNKTCMPWTEVVLYTKFGYINYGKASFPDGDIDHNQCRNVLGYFDRGVDRPWCHISDTAWEFCDVPSCETEWEVEHFVIDDRRCDENGGICIDKTCCHGNHYVENICSSMHKVCCLSEENCLWQTNSRELSWPDGEYGMTASAFGCPASGNWFSRSWGLETDNSQFSWPQGYHVQGPYTDTLFQIRICERDSKFSLSSNRWEPGLFCLIKTGIFCPTGFSEEEAVFTLESGMKKEANLPDSCEDDSCLSLTFCCKSDGDYIQAIRLPTTVPFILFKMGDRCQEVFGMTSKEETLTISSHTNMTTSISTLLHSAISLNGTEISFNFCYYETTEPDMCYNEPGSGFFYRGSANTTIHGPCTSWSDVRKKGRPELYHHVGLETGNACRNTMLFEMESRPWCYAGGEKVFCDIPKCEDEWESYRKVGYHKPARQKLDGDEEAQLVVDGNMDTCSEQMEVDTWWQVNLQGEYEIHAVEINRQRIDWCVLRMFDIHVSMEADDFLTHGATLCARNVTAGPAELTVVKCVQPLRGQFITIQNLAHIGSEPYPADYVKCLYICEVSAYAKDTSCGRMLLDRSVVNEVESYYEDHEGGMGEAFTISLYGEAAWCPMKHSHMFLQINLLYPRRVERLMTQSARNSQGFVSSFSFMFGQKTDNMFTYMEKQGNLKIFNRTADTYPQLHNLMNHVSASIIRLNVLDYVIQPCLRIEVVGCATENVDLALRRESEQSSVYTDPVWHINETNLPGVALDGNDVTCSTTQLEETTWWRVHMDANFNVHSVVFKTGNAFAWNLVALRPANQSTVGWEGWGWKANDGNPAPNFWDGSCTHTLEDESPWWTVDLGEVVEVKSVAMINRDDCCSNRLENFEVRLGNNFTNDFNPRSWQLCVGFNDVFPAGSTKTFTCDEPIRARYLSIILPRLQYMTLCEVWAFGERAPLNIAVNDDSSPISEKGSCSPRSYTVDGEPVHSSQCQSTGSSTNIYLPTSGPMSLCSVNVYGGDSADIRNITDTMTEVKCLAADTKLHVQYGAEPDKETIMINSDNLQKLLHSCEGQDTCFVPREDLTGSTLNLRFICTYITHQDRKCTDVIEEEKQILTPNFPFFYGLDVHCSWTILAPPGQFAALNVTAFRLAGQVQDIEDGCNTLKQGECEDTAVVYYSETSVTAIKSLLLEGTTLYISDTNFLRFSFQSCSRLMREIREEQFGIAAQAEFYDCNGCGVQHTTDQECTASCGYIITPGYPVLYKPNTKQTWTIVVEKQHYVLLQFTQFDVYELPLQSCTRDYVEVVDYDLRQNEIPMGRFCNAQRPHSMQSSWNRLKLVFVTDYENESKGFKVHYKQLSYQLPEEFPFFGSSRDCPDGWMWFEDNCYMLFSSPEPLSWFAAEETCDKMYNCHLASITNREEMIFIHFMLTTTWKTNDTRTFIGLSDQKQEGIWLWTDENPLTYSDWAEQATDVSTVSQPDGASVEDCSMILLDNLYSTRTWHDIPCAFNQVNQFLCKKTIQIQNESSLSLPEYGRNITKELKSRFFQCTNTELILNRFLCDGSPDCSDQSDETSCILEGTSGCPASNYRCGNGDCISMSSYCDFVSDCDEGEDEIGCVIRDCAYDEWRCTNKECIPHKHRCNLVPNCVDQSDEMLCDECQTEVAFQCFDGTCIPKAKKCDGVINCPGSLHEDEGDDCREEAILASCLDWKIRGATEFGNYEINPSGEGSFHVDCDMTSDPDYVKSVVHHDAEERVYVSGYANVNDYIKQVTYYGADTEQVKALKNNSLFCRQFLHIECWAASGTEQDYWINIDGEKILYHSSASDGCQCTLDHACQMGRKMCHCTDAQNLIPSILTQDFGYLTSLSDLPVMGISLSGTSFLDIQYQYHTLGPLECFQLSEYELDQLQCRDGSFVPRKVRCLMSRDQYGVSLGCRDASHLVNCENLTCPEDYIKCPDTYCIPHEFVCDGQHHCPAGEDEQNCGDHTCPGAFSCRHSKVCIPPSQVCDGNRNCPLADDEERCDVTCPRDCTCLGLSVFCINGSSQNMPAALDPDLKKLDLTGNLLKSVNNSELNFHWLGELILSHNQINQLVPDNFRNLVNLYLLELSYNMIVILPAGVFAGLRNLVSLNLLGNTGLTVIQPGCFSGLVALPALVLKNMMLKTLGSHTFDGLIQIKFLDLSKNNISSIHDQAFEGLEKVNHLNMSNNEIDYLAKIAFNPLISLAQLESDKFKFCCYVSERVDEENCLPERDAFSSCDDLMRREVLKAFLWVLGLMAFLCNGFVILWRMREKLTVYSFCVLNLAVADFLMGVYMVIIASVDVYYKGVYIEYAESWQSSWLCQFLGVINTISSEESVFTLCVISADRFYKIVFPFEGAKFNMRKARIVIGLTWIISVLIAVIPLFPIPYFNNQYYSRSSVCLSLHITKETSPGWEYSAAIFHLLNFMCFVFIFLAYLYLYRVVKRSSADTKQMTKGQKPQQSDITLARKLTVVVATDFFCWVPINIMGVAAMAGADIGGEVYAWVVVFLLPVNSAINPLLYTVSSLQNVNCCKKNDKVVSEGRSTGTKMTTDESGGSLVVSNPKPDALSLKAFLTNNTTMPVSTVIKLAKDLALLLKEVHERGQGLGKFDPSSIILTGLTNEEYAVSVLLNSDSLSLSEVTPTQDICDLGQVITSLLRRAIIKK